MIVNRYSQNADLNLPSNIEATIRKDGQLRIIYGRGDGYRRGWILFKKMKDGTWDIKEVNTLVPEDYDPCVRTLVQLLRTAGHRVTWSMAHGERIARRILNRPPSVELDRIAELRAWIQSGSLTPLNP